MNGIGNFRYFIIGYILSNRILPLQKDTNWNIITVEYTNDICYDAAFQPYFRAISKVR